MARSVATAYVAIGSMSICNASPDAMSVKQDVRRLLRDVVVWRCCLQVGFGCRDRLMREFVSAFEVVDVLCACVRACVRVHVHAHLDRGLQCLGGISSLGSDVDCMHADGVHLCPWRSFSQELSEMY